VNLIPFAIGWVALLIVILVLAFYRSRLSREEDDIPHISEPEAEVYASRQIAVAKKLEKVEFWGKTLTVLLILYGLVLAAVFSYQAWEQSSRITR